MVGSNGTKISNCSKPLMITNRSPVTPFFVLQSRQSIKIESEKLVFSFKNSQRFDNIQTAWENIKKLACITNFRWHDMRHHFASRLVIKGVPLNNVRELLGHTSVDMTLRYAHLAPEQKERAVAMLDRVD